MIMTNINPETGIRYGVVDPRNLQEWVWDEIEMHGTNLSFEAWQKENPDSDSDGYESDEEVLSYKKDGLVLTLDYLGGAPLIFVIRSPHTTKARLCSPCVPNAGDLDSQHPDGEECYTLPPDWWPDQTNANNNN